jgi:signal recognition particle subunit SRP54
VDIGARPGVRLPHYLDVLIVDTAGRLAIDDMMHEIADLHALHGAVETLCVVDMQGQDAVNVAKAFRRALPLTGVILKPAAMRSGALSVATPSTRRVRRRRRETPGLEVFIPGAGARPRHGRHSLLVEAHRDRPLKAGVAEKVKRKGLRTSTADQQMTKMGGIASMMDKLPAQLGAGIDPAASGRQSGSAHEASSAR